MVNFQIGDLISRINVSCIGNKVMVRVLNTKFNLTVLKFFISKNLIQNYIILNDREVLVYLRSIKANGYVFKKIEVISKPSKRVYLRSRNYNKNVNFKKYSLIIISTSKGLMSIQEALMYKIGGEVILGIKS